MRGDSNERLTILSEAEKIALYGIPAFDDFQRVEFFAMTDTERSLALGRKSFLAQVYCLLQIGYFKAKQAFFIFSLDDVPHEDVDFLLQRYFPGQTITNAPLLFPLGLRYFSSVTKDIKEDEHVSGARLISEKALAKSEPATGILKFGTVHLSHETERTHIFIAGQTGSGKSTALFQQLDSIQRANRRCLIIDNKGEFMARYYRPEKDIILQPLDERGIGWTVLKNEVITKPDLHAITGSLIPPGHGDEKFWQAAAEAVLRGVMGYCWNQGTKQNSDLWKALTAPTNEIAEMCKVTAVGKAGYTFVQDASSKQAQGVCSVLMSFVSWMEYANDGDFSMRKWIQNNDGSTIFLRNHADVKNTLKPYLSLFADLLGKRINSLPENDNPQKNIYMIFDELGNFQKMPTLLDIMSESRSRGGCVTISVQEMARLESIYRPEDTKVIMNNCATQMFMRLKDGSTRKVVSESLGEEEYWQSSTSYTIKDGKSGGENHGREIRKRFVVTPDDLHKLERGAAYLSLSGRDPALINIKLTDANRRIPGHNIFIPRRGLDMDEVRCTSIEIAAAAEIVLKTPPPPELVELVEKNAIEAVDAAKRSSELLISRNSR